VTNTGVIQIDSVHQVMQSDVRVASIQARKERSEQPKKCVDRIATKGAEEQVEPNHIRLELSYDPNEANCTTWIVE
jgi:hypothetical protein